MWKCRPLFRLSRLWKGTSKSANWVEVIHSILGEKMRLDKVSAEVFFLWPVGEKWCIFRPPSPSCERFTGQMLSRCSSSLQMSGRRSHAPSLLSPCARWLSAAPHRNTACQDALDNDLMQGVKSGEGGFFFFFFQHPGVLLCNLRPVGGVHRRGKEPRRCVPPTIKHG